MENRTLADLKNGALGGKIAVPVQPAEKIVPAGTEAGRLILSEPLGMGEVSAVRGSATGSIGHVDELELGPDHEVSVGYGNDAVLKFDEIDGGFMTGC
ncbi:MAG TPA: hypothetical protein VKS24_19615 [Bradyrhizobium sp.]|nr:hypothetical protein [Bradyrhizobium sp.]